MPESNVVRILSGLFCVLVCLALVGYQVSVGYWVWPAIMLAAAMGSLGAFLLFGQGRTISHPDLDPPHEEPVEGLWDKPLRRRIDSDPLPFGLCVRCRLIDHPPAFHRRCPRCDAGSDYLIIEDDRERSMAKSAAGLPSLPPS